MEETARTADPELPPQVQETTRVLRPRRWAPPPRKTTVVKRKRGDKTAHDIKLLKVDVAAVLWSLLNHRIVLALEQKLDRPQHTAERKQLSSVLKLLMWDINDPDLERMLGGWLEELRTQPKK